MFSLLLKLKAFDPAGLQVSHSMSTCHLPVSGDPLSPASLIFLTRHAHHSPLCAVIGRDEHRI